MTVYIIPVEPHPQRYTIEWDSYLPLQMEKAVRDRGLSQDVRVIDGGATSGQTAPGAFLNFDETNIFKSRQVEDMAQLFQRGDVRAGDTFLFADAWHPGAISLRYMSELARIPVRMIGLFHAGAYDPHDFLGRMDKKQWSLAFERSLVEVYDDCCFATDFHIDLITKGLGIKRRPHMRRVGWPMEYLAETLTGGQPLAERNIVLFPHRLSPEKQVGIFRDLASSFPDHEFVVCQDRSLSKPEYHDLLRRTAVVFSASLQETLGIGVYEGLLCGARPFVPDRLSYREMYPSEFLYPSAYTASDKAYRKNKRWLIAELRQALNESRNGQRTQLIAACRSDLGRDLFSGRSLYDLVLDKGTGRTRRRRRRHALQRCPWKLEINQLAVRKSRKRKVAEAAFYLFIVMPLILLISYLAKG